MTDRRIAVVRSVAVAACLLAAACGPAPDGRDSDGMESAADAREAFAADSVRGAAVAAAARGFKKALARGDSAAALARLHPEAVIHEGGHAETRSEYRSGHLGADMEFLGAMVTETTREEVLLGREQALYLSEYRMTGSMGGDTLRLRGVETMVLVPTDGDHGSGSAGSAEDGSAVAGDPNAGPDWLIRHIHWSSRETEGEG